MTAGVFYQVSAIFKYPSNKSAANEMAYFVIILHVDQHIFRKTTDLRESYTM